MASCFKVVQQRRLVAQGCRGVHHRPKARCLHVPKEQVCAQAVVYCKRLSTAAFARCPALGTLLMWSDQLTALSLQDSQACSSACPGA